MNTKIEKEYEARSMISEEKYFEIASDFYRRNPHLKVIVQKNQYFDTEDLYLTNHNIVLRIRVNSRGAILTLKIGNGEHEAKEISQKISYFQHKALIEKSHFPKGQVKLSIMGMGIPTQSVKYICDVKTKRTQIDGEGYNYCVDENEYRGIKDYNIEVESHSVEDALKRLKELAKQYNFEITKDYVVKSKRAILKKE